MNKLAIATVLAVTLWNVGANADVVVRGDTTTVDKPKLDGLVELELGGNTDVDEVTIDVSGSSASVVLRRRTGESRTGSVHLPTDGPGDVERTMALFVGELSREPEPEPEPPRATIPAPPPPDRSAPTPVERPSGASPGILAGMSGRAFTSGGALFLGPFLGGSMEIDRLELAVVGRYAVASENVALGTVKARIASVGVVGAYRLVEAGLLAIRAGVDVDLGWIEGEGDGGRAHTASGFGVATAGFLDARWPVSRAVFVMFAIEGGALVPGLDLRAGDRIALTASGAFAGASVGLGFAP